MAAENDLKHWKQSYEAKLKEYSDLQNIYKEFQNSSQEFETELETELSQAHAENERLRNKLSKSETQVRKLRDELDRFRAQSNSEIAALQKKVIANGAQSEIERALLKLEQEKAELERRSSQQIKDLQDKVDAANEQNELLQTELEEVASTNVESTQHLKQQLRDAQAELVLAMERAGTGAGEDPTRNEKYNSLVNELKGEIRELNAMVESLTEEKVQLEARLLEESELNEELTAEVSDLTDDFMANSDKIEELETKLKQYQESYGDGTKPASPSPAAPASPTPVAASASSGPTVPAAQLANMVPKERLAQAEGQISKLLDEKKQLEEQLRDKSDQIDNLRDEISNVSDEHLATTRKLANLEKSVAENEERARLYDNAQVKARQLQDQFSDLQSRLDEAETRAKEAESQLEEMQSKAQNQVKGTTLNLAAVSRERDELQSQVYALQAELQQVQSEAENSKKREADMEAQRLQQLEVQSKMKSEKSKREADLLTKIKAAQAAGAKGGKDGIKAQKEVVNLSVQALKGTVDGMSNELASASSDIVSSFKGLRNAFSQISSFIISTETNYKKEQEERRKLFDSLQDIKGNIRVFCRIRPLLPRELTEAAEEVVEFPGDQQLAFNKKATDRIKIVDGDKNFNFDRVYGPFSSQVEVFKDVEGLVNSVLDGYNVCIFAYGQTGSGKTYTMEGPPNERGINYRAVNSIFKRIKALHPQFSYKVSVSLMEIYNERLRDLLDSENVAAFMREAENAQPDDDDSKDEDSVGGGKLQIRKGPNGMFVTNITKFGVKAPEEVLDVIALGAKNRAVGTTNMNEHSSRSHSIFMLEVDGIDNLTQNKFFGKLYLVDLAGSERLSESQVTGQRLVEATYINKSLSALGDVMNALSATKKGHVPYRNSKLTFLLQDALGGNSKTLMFVNCSPADRYVNETLCSLQFARRARMVRLSANAAVENATFNKYKNQMDEISEQKKSAEDKMKRSLEKMENKLKEKDTLINELSEKVRSINTKAYQMEQEKKKELAILQDKTERMTKQANMSDEKGKLAKKQQQMEEKLEHLTQLLKLSQRENKTLKETLEAKSREVKRDDSNNDATRKVREEALKRKKLEEANDSNSRSIAKQLEDKDQLIRLLREKNHKMEMDMQQLKTSIKKADVTVLAGAVKNPRAAKRPEFNRSESTSPERGTMKRDESGRVSPTGSVSSVSEEKDRIQNALRQHQQMQQISGAAAGTGGASFPRKNNWMAAVKELNGSDTASQSSSAANSRTPSVSRTRDSSRDPKKATDASKRTSATKPLDPLAESRWKK